MKKVRKKKKSRKQKERENPNYLTDNPNSKYGIKKRQRGRGILTKHSPFKVIES